MTKLSDQEAEVRALDEAIHETRLSLNALKNAIRRVDVAHQHALAASGAIGATRSPMTSSRPRSSP